MGPCFFLVNRLPWIQLKINNSVEAKQMSYLNDLLARTTDDAQKRSMDRIQVRKARLAKLLAAENITVVHRSVGTASFDLLTRRLTLPILDSSLTEDEYDMLILHEVGHALFTDPDDWFKALDTRKGNGAWQSYLNIIEDIRIEARVKERYPGCRKNFLNGYANLVNKRDFFHLAGVDLTKLILADRLNIHFKIGTLISVPFTAVEMKDIVLPLASIRTWNEVVSWAEVLWQHQTKVNKDTKAAATQDDEKFGSFEDMCREMQENACDSEDGEAYGIDSDDEDEDDGESESCGAGGDNKDKDDEMAPQTDEAERESLRKMVVIDPDADPVSGRIPTFDTKHYVMDFREVLKLNAEVVEHCQLLGMFDGTSISGKDFAQTISASEKITSAMVEDFNRFKAARVREKTRIHQTGDLNLNRLPYYKIADDIFLTRETRTNGKNHGLVMFVDWSGSMIGQLPAVVEQMINLAMFAHKAGIPFEIYAFSNNDSTRVRLDEINGLAEEDRVSLTPSHSRGVTYKEGDCLLMDNRLVLINFLSSRMSRRELDMGIKTLWSVAYERPYDFALSGTPLCTAIMVSQSVIKEFQQKNRTDITNTVWITDGEACDSYGPVVIENGKDVARYSMNNVILLDDGRDITTNRHLTAALYRATKENTGATMIGFFLMPQAKFPKYKGPIDHSGRSLYSVHRYGRGTNEYWKQVREYGDESKAPESTDVGGWEILRTKWNEEGFLTVPGPIAHDEYYVLNTNKLSVNRTVDFDDMDTVGMSVRKVTTAFLKAHRSDKTSRVFVRKFVERISKHVV